MLRSFIAVFINWHTEWTQSPSESACSSKPRLLTTTGTLLFNRLSPARLMSTLHHYVSVVKWVVCQSVCRAIVLYAYDRQLKRRLSASVRPSIHLSTIRPLNHSTNKLFDHSTKIKVDIKLKPNWCVVTVVDAQLLGINRAYAWDSTWLRNDTKLINLVASCYQVDQLGSKLINLVASCYQVDASLCRGNN